jgi:hypothetical protein
MGLFIYKMLWEQMGHMKHKWPITAKDSEENIGPHKPLEI